MKGDLIRMMSLDAIIELLKSDNYIDRFKGEYYLIKDKYQKLHKVIIKREANTLDFEPTCSLELWKAQASAMGQYLYQLEVRAEVEHITL